MAAIATNGKPIESVWDFPRPPAIDKVDWGIRVVHGGETIADATWAYRILETSQPPAYYVDPSFVDGDRLRTSRPMSRVRSRERRELHTGETPSPWRATGC